MRKLLLAILAVLLVAGMASAQQIGDRLPTDGEPGYSADFDSNDAAGTYKLGNSLTSISYNFTFGSNFVGALWDCDTLTQSAATCDKITDLTSAGESGTATTKHRVLLVVITTPEGAGTMSTLTVKGGYSVSSGGGGGGALDDFTTVSCSAGVATIPAASGVYRIPPSGCTSGQIIRLDDVGALVATAGLQYAVVNDSGVALVLDAATNNSGSTVESGSLTVTKDSTFSVIQTAASLVHVIGTGEGLSFTQTIPAASVIHEPYVMNITDPTTTRFGWGMTEAPQNFPATPSQEPDHQFGTYYNLNGANGTPINQFEHAWNWKAETSFRDSSGTSNKTWVEWNKNVWPADNSSVVTGWNSTAFVVDEAITFTGSGATGKVLAWDGTTLTFRMDGGGDPDALDAISASGSGAAATLGATVTNVSTRWRPYLEVYDTLDNTLDRQFFTAPGDDPIVVIRDGGVGINWAGGVNQNFVVGTKLGQTTTPGLWVRYLSDGFDGGGGGTTVVPIGLLVDRDYRGTNMTFSGGASLRIGTPFGTIAASSSINNPIGLEVRDQGGYAQNGAAISVSAQTCSAGGSATACTVGNTGNIAMEGGDYNNGHLVFGNRGNLGTHVWANSANDELMVRKASDPNSPIAGERVATHTNLDAYTLSYQAISEASFNTGDKVCNDLVPDCIDNFSTGGPPQTGGSSDGFCDSDAVTPVAVGQCVTNGVWDLTAGAAVACTAAITSGNMFMVMCK